MLSRLRRRIFSCHLHLVSKLTDLALQHAGTSSRPIRTSDTLQLPGVFFCERLRSSDVSDINPVYRTTNLACKFDALSHCKAGRNSTSFYAGPCAGMVKRRARFRFLVAAVCFSSRSRLFLCRYFQFQDWGQNETC